VKEVDRISVLRPKSWERKTPAITKRTKFIISALFLSLGVSLITVFLRGKIALSLIILAVLSLILVFGTLAKELAGIRFFLLPVLPTGFIIFTVPFFFILNLGWLGKFLPPFVYGLTFYLIMLVLNIYNISTQRVIPLLHAAQAAGFLFTLVSVFAAYSLILLLGLTFWQNAMLLGLVSFPFILFSLWSVGLGSQITRNVWLYASALSLILAQMAYVCAFWPVGALMAALFLASVFYALVGIVQLYLGGRLSFRLGLEYFGVGVVVLFLLIMSASW
jgi:hypothetical protein